MFIKLYYLNIFIFILKCFNTPSPTKGNGHTLAPTKGNGRTPTQGQRSDSKFFFVSRSIKRLLNLSMQL